MWSFKRAVDYLYDDTSFGAALFLGTMFLTAVFLVATILIILFETFGLYTLFIIPLYALAYLFWAGWEKRK